MKWFHTYSSNTIAGSGSQYYFTADEHTPHTGRIYYKVFAGGCYHYSLLFSNIIDSTFADGSVSHCNLLCDEWDILNASIGVCKECSPEQAGEVSCLQPLTFLGSGSKHVMPGEFFVTDPVEIQADKGDYLCLEITYQGRMLPYHEESLLPAFVLENGHWTPCKHVPFPGMIGCDRPVKSKIGFLGDSITQGIGTEPNSYAHWNALAAEGIGEEYSYWNLGLGYGRASDAASDGAWLFKAKQLDKLVVCFGTNDVLHVKDNEAQIKKDLLIIIRKLKAAGVKVLLQSLPPFDYTGENLEKWLHVNDYVRNTLAKEADGFFDVVPSLIDGEECTAKSRYGGHPNAEGCKAWADALLPAMKNWLQQ